MDNILCIIGTVSLIISFIIAFNCEAPAMKEDKHTDKKKEKTTKDKLRYYDAFKMVVITSSISVVSFILFGVSLYISGHMW